MAGDERIPEVRAFLTICFLLIAGLAQASDYAAHPVPSLPRPALGQTMTDPVFNSQVTRRTDPNWYGNGTLGFVHEYSRFPVVSADNSLIVLEVLGGPQAGTWEIRDLATRALRYRLSPQGDPEFSWHRTDPNRLFYRSGNQVRVFHVDTGQSENLMSFLQYDSIGANEEGRPSDDWRYYAFVGVKGSNKTVGVVDLVVKRVLATLPADPGLDWVGMSPSGNYVVTMSAGGTQIYSRDLSTSRPLLSNSAHSDFAIDAQGNEVLVYQATENGQIDELACPNPPNGSPYASARLSDSKKTILLGECNKADWTPVVTGAPIGWWFTSHFSGIASRSQPGWVLVSTYTAPGNTQQPFSREVFWLALDGSGQVRRVAQHHSDQSTDGSGSKDYWAEPHATSSWDGSLLVFASVWGSPFAQYDVYTSGASAPIPPTPTPGLRCACDFLPSGANYIGTCICQPK